MPQENPDSCCSRLIFAGQGAGAGWGCGQIRHSEMEKSYRLEAQNCELVGWMVVDSAEG